MTPFLRFLARLRRAGGRVIPRGSNPDAAEWFRRERRKADERRELAEFDRWIERQWHDDEGRW
jgi:hypothetical protein